MNAHIEAHGVDAEPRSERAVDRGCSPTVFALDRLFPKRGQAPYATAERLVVLVIMRAMSFDEREGVFNCFLSVAARQNWTTLARDE